MEEAQQFFLRGDGTNAVLGKLGKSDDLPQQNEKKKNLREKLV